MWQRASSGSGGGGGTLKDAIRNKVLNGGLTNIATLSATVNRVTFNESGIVADKTSHTLYVYADFTVNVNFGSASDWASVMNITAASGETWTNYLPRTYTSLKTNCINLTTDEESSDPTKVFMLGYVDSTYKDRIFVPYNVTVTAGQHYIIYGAYTY